MGFKIPVPGNTEERQQNVQIVLEACDPLEEFASLAIEIGIETVVENFAEDIPTFETNEETWEHDVLFGPVESPEEEQDEILTPDVVDDEDTPITYSEIKKDWYALKCKIQKKDCSYLIQLIERMDEALYLETKQKQKQSVIENFFQSNNPSNQKKPKVVIELEDDHESGDHDIDNKNLSSIKRVI